MSVQIIHGHCIDELRRLPWASVNCVVTSPPYWSMRSYGSPPQVWGGKPKCEHVWQSAGQRHKGGPHGDGVLRDGGRAVISEQAKMKDFKCGEFCSLCSAWRGEIGHEPSVDLYIRHMVQVFAAVHRVLRDDGVLWMNMGDCFAGSGWSGGTRAEDEGTLVHRGRRDAGRTRSSDGFKPKDLVPQSWMLAIALQRWGWYLRCPIIWEKPSCMPESTKDRPTISHEYLFLLSKSSSYFYDADAIKEPSSPESHARYRRGRSNHHKYAGLDPNGGHPQSIAQSFEHMRKPGVGPKAELFPDVALEKSNQTNGVGPKEQIRQDQGLKSGERMGGGAGWRKRPKQNASFCAAVGDLVETRNKRTVWTIASEPLKEEHFAAFPTALVRPCVLAGCPKGGVVLDPFGGSGTVGIVAEEEGRNSILIELNPPYVEIARRRTAQTGLLHET